MVKITYSRWELSGETVRAYGGKKKPYIHYLPLDDVIQIGNKFLDIYEKEGAVSHLDILDEMHNISLSGGRIFNKNTQKYKVEIVFDILLKEGLIRQEGIKKYHHNQKGRNPYGYVIEAPGEEIKCWLSRQKPK